MAKQMQVAVVEQFGSPFGTRQDLAEALAFAAEGKGMAAIELQPLSSIPQVFERLEPGDVASLETLQSENWSTS